VEVEKLVGCCDYIFCFQEQLSIMIFQLVVLTSHIYILLAKHQPNARVVNHTMNHYTIMISANFFIKKSFVKYYYSRNVLKVLNIDCLHIFKPIAPIAALQ
jgi:hypothetical protein